MKKLIEDKCIKVLYNCGFQRHGEIFKEDKKIIFDVFGVAFFKMFIKPKEIIAISILQKWYKYKIYEKQLCLTDILTPGSAPN